jgi:hypothetical protein
VLTDGYALADDTVITDLGKWAYHDAVLVTNPEAPPDPTFARQLDSVEIADEYPRQLVQQCAPGTDEFVLTLARPKGPGTETVYDNRVKAGSEQFAEVCDQIFPN